MLLLFRKNSRPISSCSAKNSIRKRPFSPQKNAKTQKSARGIFGQKNARVRNDLGQKKAGGGQNAGNPLGLVGGKEKKFDQKKKLFNSQVRFRFEIKKKSEQEKIEKRRNGR